MADKCFAPVLSVTQAMMFSATEDSFKPYNQSKEICEQCKDMRTFSITSLISHHKRITCYVAWFTLTMFTCQIWTDHDQTDK